MQSLDVIGLLGCVYDRQLSNLIPQVYQTFLSFGGMCSGQKKKLPEQPPTEDSRVYYYVPTIVSYSTSSLDLQLIT